MTQRNIDVMDIIVSKMAEGAKLELTFPGRSENARDQIHQHKMSKLLLQKKKKI